MKLILVFLLSLLNWQVGHAFLIESDGKTSELIELYTSESCSSCPPAEKWMNSLKSAPTLWVDYVPVEFHVDYWNHLHWVDKYSQKEFSKRQREYHRKISGGVYTPQIIKHGVNQRKWYRKNILKKRKRKKELGSLKANLNLDKGVAKITFKTSYAMSSIYSCNIALMAGKILTKIKDGENSGKLLAHEFAVIEFKKKKVSVDKNNKSSCIISFTKSDWEKLNSKSIAVWIANEKTGQVIQAVGNWIK